jgi:hypothetical protein
MAEWTCWLAGLDEALDRCKTVREMGTTSTIKRV